MPSCHPRSLPPAQPQRIPGPVLGLPLASCHRAIYSFFALPEPACDFHVVPGLTLTTCIDFSLVFFVSTGCVICLTAAPAKEGSLLPTCMCVLHEAPSPHLQGSECLPSRVFLSSAVLSCT